MTYDERLAEIDIQSKVVEALREQLDQADSTLLGLQREAWREAYQSAEARVRDAERRSEHLQQQYDSLMSQGIELKTNLIDAINIGQQAAARIVVLETACRWMMDFPCCKCGVVFDCAEKLAEHVTSHDGDTPWSREDQARIALGGIPCANGHVWSNQYGDDWKPDDGTPCDCRQKLWGVKSIGDK
jgi:hypothetical protein